MFCLRCGDYTDNPKFCSRSCAATYNNTGNRRHGNDPGECVWCGEPKREYAQSYCSRECGHTHRRHLKIKAWLCGEWDGAKSSGEMSRVIRTYVLEEAEYTCTKCGWNEISPTLGYPPVQIDHIDGIWTNHSPDNLTVLCPNCHSLTPTFGAQNKRSPGNRSIGSKKRRP